MTELGKFDMIVLKDVLYLASAHLTEFFLALKEVRECVKRR